MPMSATHTGPPPGYMTLDEVAAALDISRQRLGAASVLGLLDSWKLPGSRARLFRAADVAEIADWRRTRQASSPSAACPPRPAPGRIVC